MIILRPYLVCFIVPYIVMYKSMVEPLSIYSYSVVFDVDGTNPTMDCEYRMRDYDDYEQQIRGCNRMLSSPLREGETVCYEQVVYDDLRVEDNEFINIRLHLKESEQATVLDDRYADIGIEDDDCKFYILYKLNFTGHNLIMF